MSRPHNIYEFSKSEISEYLKQLGMPGYRSTQIWEGLYRNVWIQPQEFSTLPKNLRKVLESNFEFFPLKPIRRLVSKDKQTVKILFELIDGQFIETVLMNYKKRHTVCISSQVGCAMNCSFCATGQMGYKRNLTLAEIITQVLFFARELNSQGDSLNNVVVMGMGEPFQNSGNVIAAIDRLNHPEGFNMGTRHFTISTVGLPGKIRQFAEMKSQINLAVSLHASDDTLRNQIVPINRKYPLGEVLDACRYYFNITNRRISFEWALISGINDNQMQALKLVKLIHGIKSHVNVIPLNPTEHYNGLPSSLEQAGLFKNILEKHGIACTIRLRRGIDIKAGCGQLASYHY